MSSKQTNDLYRKYLSLFWDNRTQMAGFHKDAGGVRLEDVAVITRTGCRNLTRFPKILEI